MHREPEVLEVEAQVGKWFDCRAMITSKKLAPIHSVKNGILQNACSTCPRMDADLGKSALMHTVRLMNSLAKSLKRMETKVQWLYWRLHDNWVSYLKTWSRRSLQRFCGRAQTYWSQSDVFDALKPCHVMLTFETKIHRLEWFAQVILTSVTPMLQNLRIGLKKRRNGKSEMPVKQRGNGQMYLEIKGETSNNILLTFGKLVSTFSINNWTRGKRICCRLRCVDAHEKQKGFEFRWIGNRDDIEKSDDGYNSQWWSGDAWRGNSFMSKNWVFSWQWKSSRTRQQSYRQESFAMNTDTHMSGSTVKNHISLKTGFGYNATRRTSFQSWFLVDQRVLPQACLIHHPWHL